MNIEWKIGILAALLIGGGIWWNFHNRKEENIGAQACIQATTETKKEAIADNVITIDQHNQAISAVVKSYESRIKDLADSNGDLAQRLHDANAIRKPAVPALAAAAAGMGSGEGRPDTGGLTDCDRREAEVASYCAVKMIELNAIRQAWTRLHGDPAK
jgi:hypothetical protein